MTDPVVEQRLAQLTQRLQRAERKIAGQQVQLAAVPVVDEDQQSWKRLTDEASAQQGRMAAENQRVLDHYRETGELPAHYATYGPPPNLVAALAEIDASRE